ncbi:uncharacterized protein LOC122626928 [Vespula pensylvanica]|uniref:uncharacterized protein LOC122626928 n=1 Tax=Vespula pensylvanica TaxID=30213 RepID=UPI001CB9EF3D|nr:uncharacterized protein LOC122626928 [Vespula pensylvanica]
MKIENMENLQPGDRDRQDNQNDLQKEVPNIPNNHEELMIEDNGHRNRSSKTKCRCKKRKRRLRLSRNPFIIFYLKMYFESPCKRVVDVAREAGKIWCRMTSAQKQKYIRLARKLQCRKR